MATGVIKEDEAASLIKIIEMLIPLVDQKIITQEQANSLKAQLNDKLHEALGLE